LNTTRDLEASGFRSQGQDFGFSAGLGHAQEVVEREADEFAAALLIPSSALKQKLARRAFMTLEEILKVANEWETSATSAAIRYANFTSEACGVVISQGEVIKYFIPSEEAATVGFQVCGKREKSSAKIEGGGSRIGKDAPPGARERSEQ